MLSQVNKGDSLENSSRKDPGIAVVVAAVVVAAVVATVPESRLAFAPGEQQQQLLG